MKLPIYIAALAFANQLQARPTYLPGSPGSTCMACHAPPAAAVLGLVTFLKLNGSAPSAPFGVTLSAGSSFTVEYRITGFDNGGGFPRIGGYIRPSTGTAGWTVSTGPSWTDNGQSAATPWSFQNNVAFGSGYGADGTTLDDGGASDLNLLGSNEVFSATIQAASLAPGSYDLFIGGAHRRTGPAAETADDRLYVIVVQPSPTETPSISPTPNLSHSPTDSPTTSPTFSESPTFSQTSTPTPVPGFPGFKQAALWPNPSLGSATLFLETYSASDSIELRIYSAAFSRSFTLDLGSYNGGRGNLPFKLPADMANGAYYYQVLSKRQGKSARSAILPFAVLR